MEEKKILKYMISFIRYFELAPDSNYESPLAKELLSHPFIYSLILTKLTSNKKVRKLKILRKQNFQILKRVPLDEMWTGKPVYRFSHLSL